MTDPPETNQQDEDDLGYTFPATPSALRQMPDEELFRIGRRHAYALALLAAMMALALGGPASSSRGLGLIVFDRSEGFLPELYVMDAGGKAHARRLAKGFAEKPAWSPDGRRIVYEAGGALAVVTPGSRPRLLARRGPNGNDCDSNDCAYDDPTWSPNGKLVAFIYVTNQSSRDNRSAVIAVVPAAGGATRFLAKTDGDRVAWSPTSSALAFTAADGIRTVDVRGERSRLVAKGRYDNPAWSRAGRIAFTAPRGVEVVNADGSGLDLVARVAGAWLPVWSPNGRLILFETVSDLSNALYVVGADGSNLHRLTVRPAFPGRPGEEATWSPDGSRIAYVVEPNDIYADSGGLAIVAPDGTHRRQLTRSNDVDPAWQP